MGGYSFMNIIRNEGVWRLFDRTGSLIITDEKQLEKIIEDPCSPLFDKDDRGFSGEVDSLYKSNTSLVDICRAAKENGARRLEVSYDFFFGGRKRTNYPDSEMTIKAFKVIHDTAKQFDLDFSASIISPLDIGGGYAHKYDETGYTCQYKEGRIDESTGSYSVDMSFQTQWTNNKGPIELKLHDIKVYAFNEERIGRTAFYYVNESKIADISHSCNYEIDNNSITVTGVGYGYGKIRVFGNIEKENVTKAMKCMVVIIYKTPELDYFSTNALTYIKSVIDLHKENGITYQGFYSDEMHIQFDWDLSNHFGHDEINIRYITENTIKEYASRFGSKYNDFYKYIIYFAYHQHDFIEGEEGKLASQHVFGKDERSIYNTWLFRKRYFEMLQSKVVELSLEAKQYAEDSFGGPIMTRAHATWQESPTCDHFAEDTVFSKENDEKISRYDYTELYQWSSSIRENMSACYDYFKWNDFLSGGGTDHPEGGNIDRNYYAQALACSFGVLNKFPYAYCAAWGSPKEVLRRFYNVGTTYGNMGFDMNQGHNLIQGISHRVTDVLSLYPLELNYVEERFGSWMVQYGYCNYITEEKLLENAAVSENGKIIIKGRSYRTLIVLFNPFMKEETFALITKFLNAGGKIIWTSIYALTYDKWGDIFGIKDIHPASQGVSLKGKNITFKNYLSGIQPMKVNTDMLPDLAYPVVSIDEDVKIVAECEGLILGTIKEYSNGGSAIYLAFRPRDDQSCSTGNDIDTMHSILKLIGAYGNNSLEVLSRQKGSKYIMNEFLNGTISIANHYRTFYEKWNGSFFRNEDEDKRALIERILPSVDIKLENEKIKEHMISYEGTDVLTYNVGSKGKILGFGGYNTQGIVIDGIKYNFTSLPSNIVWTVMPKEYLCEGINELCLVKVDQCCKAELPLAFEDINNLKVELCEYNIFSTTISVPFNIESYKIQLDITEKEKNKWIVIYTI